MDTASKITHITRQRVQAKRAIDTGGSKELTNNEVEAPKSMRMVVRDNMFRYECSDC